MSAFSLLFALLLALPVGAPDDAAVASAQRPLYPMTTCVISGEALGGMGDVIEVVHEGRLVQLCCKGCVKQFNADPAAQLARLDAAAIAAQQAHYPLDTCVVSGEAFGGELGEPIDLVHAGRYLKLCCKGCVKQIKGDPATFMRKLDAATIAAQRPRYPLDTCLISGEPLGAAPVDVLHGTTLVRLCCNGCKKEFAANPQPVIAALHAAYGERHDGRDGDGEAHGEHDRDGAEHGREHAREHDGEHRDGGR